jgi:hypothetical protein
MPAHIPVAVIAFGLANDKELTEFKAIFSETAEILSAVA